jgi:cell wall-associated NlpC family hydrolase
MAGLLAAASVSEASRPIGQLGQAIENTTIHARADQNSRVLFREQQFNYLVVVPGPSQTWSRVLMQNMTHGYIRAAHVALLPYQVMDQSPGNGSRGSFTPGPSTQLQSDLAGYALNYKGVRYVWGGNSLSNGVDCSGFVKQLFGKIGENLPRTAAEQARVGSPVHRLEDLRPGDRLYFWSARRNRIGHTGIYLGNGFFVHASYSQKQVTTDFLGDPYWMRTLVAARR